MAAPRQVSPSPPHMPGTMSRGLPRSRCPVACARPRASWLGSLPLTSLSLSLFHSLVRAPSLFLPLTHTHTLCARVRVCARVWRSRLASAMLPPLLRALPRLALPQASTSSSAPTSTSAPSPPSPPSSPTAWLAKLQDKINPERGHNNEIVHAKNFFLISVPLQHVRPAPCHGMWASSTCGAANDPGMPATD